MIASADATAFAQGMSNAMLLSALALLICIGVVVYVSRRP
jgi:DHA2 family methylenomycin A resistance protein-like MFS transporter